MHNRSKNSTLQKSHAANTRTIQVAFQDIKLHPERPFQFVSNRDDIDTQLIGCGPLMELTRKIDRKMS